MPRGVVVQVADRELIRMQQWAAGQAASLLWPLGARWQHVQAVARKATRISAILAPEEAPVLIAAAWLHDIGYAPSLHHTGVHQLDGARFVRGCGYERLACLVAHHSGAAAEIERRGFAEELAGYGRESSTVSDALAWADMTSGPNGEPVTLEQRLADVADRYGQEHPVSAGLHAAKDGLATAIERTRRRAQTCGIRLTPR